MGSNNHSYKEVGMRFSPHQGASRKLKCCVPQCNSYGVKDPTLRFHTIPKAGEHKVRYTNLFGQNQAVDRNWLWLKRLQISDSCTPHSRVCSLHFVKDDYFFPDIPAKVRNLKKTAVPSVNLPGKKNARILKKKENDLKRLERIENRKRKLESQLKTVQQKITQKETPKKKRRVGYEYVNLEQEKQSENNSCTDNQEIPDEQAVQEALQETQEQQPDKFSTYYKDEKDLEVMTGISSFKLLDLLEKIVKIVLANTEPNFSCKISKLSIRDRIVFVFTKLRHNITYKVLSVMFQVNSEEKAKTIFQRMISILSTGLRFAIHWPSKQEISKKIPECFNSFTNVRAVINFLETSIIKPKSECCQQISNSKKKEEYKVKFMTAISPCGLITYISKAFLGKSSDKAIFTESGLVNMFEKNDGLMFDKEFLLDETCLNFAVQFIKPTLKISETQQKQFPANEATFNDNIAKARLHIKKLNRRLTSFKILNSKVPTSLVCRVEQIFGVICAIVNLNSLIVKDDKKNEKS